MARTARPAPQKFRDGWRIRWIGATGRRSSEVYASRKDAQFKLDAHLLEVEQVKRGLKGLAVPDKTFAQLCDHWLATRATRKRSAKDDESIIDARLRPFFNTRKLTDLTLDHVDAFVAEWRDERSDKTVNNYLTLLVSMLNEAKERGWLREVPRIRKFKVHVFDKDYAWLRTEAELARFLDAASREREVVYAMYATAVYTGMRAGELAALRWQSVQFDHQLIVVERSFDGPTKGGDVRHLPIMAPLRPLLKTHRLRTKGELVFPNLVGEMHRPSDRIFQETLHRVLERAGFPTTKQGDRVRHYLHFHSLRHTFASWWVMKGGDIFRLQKILGHKSLQMTMRYAHLAPNAFAGDLERFGVSVPKTGEVASIANATGAPRLATGENQ